MVGTSDWSNKIALKKTLGRSYVSYERLQTVVTEIEAILNDRPPTYISSDFLDPEALTPSHLLYGRRITSLPYQEVPDDSFNDPTLGNQSSLNKRSRVVATPSIYVFSYFPFGFEGRMWDLIVSVPDHCLSFYFNFAARENVKKLRQLHVTPCTNVQRAITQEKNNSRKL